MSDVEDFMSVSGDDERPIIVTKNTKGSFDKYGCKKEIIFHSVFLLFYLIVFALVLSIPRIFDQDKISHTRELIAITSINGLLIIPIILIYYRMEIWTSSLEENGFIESTKYFVYFRHVLVFVYLVSSVGLSIMNSYLAYDKLPLSGVNMIDNLHLTAGEVDDEKKYKYACTYISPLMVFQLVVSVVYIVKVYYFHRNQPVPDLMEEYLGRINEFLEHGQQISGNLGDILEVNVANDSSASASRNIENYQVNSSRQCGQAGFSDLPPGNLIVSLQKRNLWLSRQLYSAQKLLKKVDQPVNA